MYKYSNISMSLCSIKFHIDNRRCRSCMSPLSHVFSALARAERNDEGADVSIFE